MSDELTREEFVVAVDDICDTAIKEDYPQEIQRVLAHDAALRAKIEAVEKELNIANEYLTKTHGIEDNLQASIDETELLQGQLTAMKQERVKELEEALAGKPVILTEWQQLQARCQVLEKGFADQTAIRERRETGFTETIAQLQAQLAAMRQERDRLKEALRFYADPQTYGMSGGSVDRIIQDAGKQANAALRGEIGGA